ncbi:hypothetical protein EU245_03850 [Lentibacillus lipolyticus]|nr:hypothetical protein EU245_03850 [Lentibacillus lipolyticus]
MLDELGRLWKEIDAAYIYIFITILAVYLMIRPITKWAITFRTTTFLNYMMSSLLMLVLILSGILLTTLFDTVILVAVMQCLALFGLILAVVHICQQIVRNKKKRV